MTNPVHFTEELQAPEEDEPLEDFPAWQHDALRIARDIVEEDADIRGDLCDAIRGRGAFRRFKYRIQAYGIAAAWYRYRDAALREIAMAWCEAHDIRYIET
jgi:hypothetical protein